MHIKWKTHRIRGYEYKEAVIVQSVRVDGKPRHRTIVRLGSFTPSDLNTNIGDQMRNTFWKRADSILACNESDPRSPQEHARDQLHAPWHTRDYHTSSVLAQEHPDAATLARLEAQLAAVIPRFAEDAALKTTTPEQEPTE
jgi:hypothetical protein